MHQIRRRCPSMYETLEVLKHLPAHIVREEFLIPQVENCKGLGGIQKCPPVLNKSKP